MPTSLPRACLALAAAAAVVGSCADDLTDPDRPQVVLLVSANVAASSVTAVVVEVSAPDLPAALVFNIPVANGIASGTIAVPAGSARSITMHAYDAAGIETHRGSVTTDIQPGANVAISLVLTPLAGDVPIDATLGTVTISVTPTGDTLTVGDSVALTARVVDSNGDPVAEPVGWATLDPAIATVARSSDSTGLVKTHDPGQTTIVVTFGGVGAAATIVVSPQPALQTVLTGLLFPIHVAAAPNDSARLFIVQRSGLIRVMRDGQVLPTPFLDIRSQVSLEGDFGLFSIAFHPDYAENGLFYVCYVRPDSTAVLERYQVSATDPDVADPLSAALILSVPEPFTNHNMNIAAFGPDGYLYVSLGDGGSQEDPLGNGQNLGTLHGKILRLDVDGGSPYAVPATNPFVDDPSALPEIWAYGLRNHWRMSFDRATGDLYIADNGQNLWEEIDVQPAASAGGENYGWKVMEGAHCFDPPTNCDQTGLVLPALEYPHTDGCSIIGGHVYRGSALPELVGRYFYADLCRGWVRSVRVTNGAVVDQRDHTASFGTRSSVVSFGQDARGELYIVEAGGTVYRIAPASP